MEEDKIRRIRTALPATQRVAYLNTGSVGPMPRSVAELIQEHFEQEVREGRIGANAWKLGDEARQRARAALASVINASPEEIALTHFTTEGLNIALWGLPWQQGDELVTTNVEHSAVFVPAEAIAQRFGVNVRYVDLGHGGGDVLHKIAAALNERTRLLALSHVSYCTGAALPVGEIAKLAAARGALTLVDGAQSVGAIPVDVAALGVDFYAIPGQKWLLGPEDTGALYVRRDRLDQLQRTFVGYASMSAHDLGAPLIPQPGARRYEVGLRNTPCILGQAAAVEWLRDEVGLEWAQNRIRRLTVRAREALSAVAGVTVLTPTNCAGLLSFEVAGLAPDAITQRLADEGILIRSIKDPSCNRASFGFFNTEEEIERLAQAVGRARIQAG